LNPQEIIPLKKKGILEYLLFAYKTFFKIICEAKSEIPLPKDTFVDFIKIVIDILSCDFEKLKEDDEKKTVIHFLTHKFVNFCPRVLKYA